MEKFIEKLSTYNILNNILPGVVFSYLCNRMLGIQLVDNSIVENLFIFYFIGMVISRIGSIIVEPVCKKCKIVQYAQYKDYVNASKKDEKILVLLETNNTYRTMVALGILLLLFKLFLWLKEILCWFSVASNWIIIGCLILLFGFSYRKQTKYVRDRVEVVCKGEK